MMLECLQVKNIRGIPMRFRKMLSSYISTVVPNLGFEIISQLKIINWIGKQEEKMLKLGL